jgi:RNA polymerase sigma-70 factor (ECF subfamily)
MSHGEDQNLWLEEARESSLILAAQKGDRRAFRALVEHYQRPVYRLTYALTRDHERAADLAREAFSRAWSGIAGIPSGKRFVPWLLRIARNLSVAHDRRRADDAMPSAPHDPGRAEPNGDDGAARRMRDSLAALRPDEQMALALRIVERLPYATIAKFLDHSVGVTLSRLSTARGVLCERVGDLDGAAS